VLCGGGNGGFFGLDFWDFLGRFGACGGVFFSVSGLGRLVWFLGRFCLYSADNFRGVFLILTMICTTDFIDFFGFLIVIFFGAILGRFLFAKGEQWGVFFLRAFARNGVFFSWRLHY